MVGQWLQFMKFSIKSISLTTLLFLFSLIFYLFIHFWKIEDFPIYFFTDEAQITLIGENLFQNKFHDNYNTLFPVYFEGAVDRWTPLFSAYIQGLTNFIFGKSIFVTRGTSAVVSLLAAIAVALILKKVFECRFWWAGVLLVGIIPTFFLHSRTAFETVMATSFYSCFLLFYLLYRTKSYWYIIPTLIVAMVTFYSYSNAQMVMGVTVVFLFFSDLRYHLGLFKQRKLLFISFLLGLLLAWPFLNFQKTHPGAIRTHLCTINSYWCYEVPLSSKLLQFSRNYLFALSPNYWFDSANDPERHQMKDYGRLPKAFLPLMLIGLVIFLKRIGISQYRTILLAALAAPASSSLVEIGITRVMPFVIPAAILTGVGLEAVLNLGRRFLTYPLLALLTLVTFTFLGTSMLLNTITNGPLWFRSYGLYGMQYGAKQLFVETIPKYLKQDSNLKIIVSPNWANAPENFTSFFLLPSLQARVSFRGIDDYLIEKKDWDEHTIFVLTAEEFARVKGSSKFKKPAVKEILNYPDGTAGFYFTKLTYVDDVETIMTKEREWRQKPVEEMVEIGGETVELIYSRLGMGTVENLFDGNPATLVRGLEANPFVVEFLFSQPKNIRGLSLHLGSADYALSVSLYEDTLSSQPLVYTQTYKNLPPDPKLEMLFDQESHTVAKMKLEITNLLTGKKAEIHLRELKFF